MASIYQIMSRYDVIHYLTIPICCATVKPYLGYLKPVYFVYCAHFCPTGFCLSVITLQIALISEFLVQIQNQCPEIEPCAKFHPNWTKGKEARILTLNDNLVVPGNDQNTIPTNQGATGSKLDRTS